MFCLPPPCISVKLVTVVTHAQFFIMACALLIELCSSLLPCFSVRKNSNWQHRWHICVFFVFVFLFFFYFFLVFESTSLLQKLSRPPPSCNQNPIIFFLLSILTSITSLPSVSSPYLHVQIFILIVQMLDILLIINSSFC